MYNVMYLLLQTHTDYFPCTKNPLCFPYSQLLATTDFF